MNNAMAQLRLNLFSPIKVCNRRVTTLLKTPDFPISLMCPFLRVASPFRPDTIMVSSWPSVNPSTVVTSAPISWILVGKPFSSHNHLPINNPRTLLEQNFRAFNHLVSCTYGRLSSCYIPSWIKNAIVPL